MSFSTTNKVNKVPFNLMDKNSWEEKSELVFQDKIETAVEMEETHVSVVKEEEDSKTVEKDLLIKLHAAPVVMIEHQVSKLSWPIYHLKLILKR